ncbi:zinc-binding dehydrogenase [Candidatus Nitrosotenuis chungbukensis]|nr:zinc-binding dehydrogenase [Candidatus Nitrosotenuis chungbukensis]WKT58190.1 zinc-binding dehydrogenase [Candidatus Nitrosotenuis chungbukensis]
MQLITERTTGTKRYFQYQRNWQKRKTSRRESMSSLSTSGARTGTRKLTLLKYGATLVTTGATTGYDVQTDLRHIFFKGTNVLGSTQGTRAELEEAMHWMSRGKIRSIIDSVYSLEDAVDAHTKMLKGNVFGKILMKP